MPRHPRRLAATAVALVVLATLSPGGDAAQAAPPAAAVPTPPATAHPAGSSVTLITGDVVRLSPAGDGRYAATVDPAPGRDDVTFHTSEVDGELRVVPQDAVPYLGSGLLDLDLFTVSALIRDGYADADREELPLIVEYGAGPRTALRSDGVRATHQLASIGGGALTVRHDSLPQWWQALTGDQDPAGSASVGTFDGGVKRIWLDGRVHAALDQSTTQVGAPAAWAEGLDGSGIDVAVLDSGVDLHHPDLEDRIDLSQDFTGSGTVQDGHGHGTHVAGIVLGSGAASSQSRRGVAPGARLLAGRVLDDWGFGQESWVLEGMEWAARNGADIVNMSLGGGSGSDGTDPLSEALDQLSRDTGTLFVVAAGNDGEDESIGSPGVASEALTVGAVDRDGALAPFSSRGPRVGDLAVKPEITAPGVGIAAPRAAGTWMGTPIDDLYTRASGTSMATPHVAGAAAILAQQHPQWTGRQIKAALVGSAVRNPDLNPFQQGNGMLRVDRAISVPVTSAGVVNLGSFVEGTDATPVTVEVAYTNSSTEDLTLELALSIENVRTHASENDAVGLQRDSLFVPAGTKATAYVDVDPAKLARGRHAGYLTAAGPDGLEITTALGTSVQPPTYHVTFEGVGWKGETTGVPTLILQGTGETADLLSYVPRSGTATFEVQADTYLMSAVIEHGAPLDEQVSYLVDPELEVDRDMTIVLDARQVTPVRIKTPKPAEQQGILSYYVHRITGTGREIANGVMHFSTIQTVNVSPTDPVSSGEFEFTSRWQLVAPMVTTTVDGVPRDWDVNLLHTSPSFDGVRQWPLVYAGTGSPAELAKAGVTGKAVVVEGDLSQTPERSQIDAAAAAGAAALLIVRTPDFSAWTVWQPEGERLPLPALVVANDDGQQLLAKARTGRSRLTLGLQTRSPYLYDVIHVERGAVPATIVHRVSEKNTAQIRTTYGDMGGFPWTKEQRFGWRPWQGYAWNDNQRFVATPHVREEWVSAGDSLWQHRVDHEYFWGDMQKVETGLTGPVRSYGAQAGVETWFGAVIRPAAPGRPGAPTSTRTADQLRLRIPEVVDGDGHHALFTWWKSTESARMTVRRNGQLLGSAESGSLDLDTVPGAAQYEVSLQTRRTDPEWTWATSTDSTWTFESQAPAGDGSHPLPMLQADYRPGVVRTVPRLGRQVPLVVSFRNQVGDPARIGRLTVAVSTDAGKRWTPVTAVRLAPNRYLAVLTAGGARAVSVRIDATARDGRRLRQTVVDAIRVR